MQIRKKLQDRLLLLLLVSQGCLDSLVSLDSQDSQDSQESLDSLDSLVSLECLVNLVSLVSLDSLVSPDSPVRLASLHLPISTTNRWLQLQTRIRTRTHQTEHS